MLGVLSGGSKDGVIQALQEGAYVDAKDDQGWTALVWSMMGCCVDLVIVLAQHSADPNVLNECSEAWKNFISYFTILHHILLYYYIKLYYIILSCMIIFCIMLYYIDRGFGEVLDHLHLQGDQVRRALEAALAGGLGAGERLLAAARANNFQAQRVEDKANIT